MALNSCDFPPYCVNRPPAHDPSDGVDAGMIRPAITTSDLRAAHSRPYVYADAAFPATVAQPRTAIDYRFAPEGLVGSVGYSEFPDGRPMALDEVGLATSVGFGRRPGGLVGAWLHYDFR
jgi:hypothetical protein